MDGLEKEAIEGMPAPEPGAPANPDPGQQAPGTGDLRETQEFKDAVQEATKGFQGDYTQKTQAIAAERRDLQAQRESLDQERQQVLAAIDRPQDTNESLPTLTEQLPAHVREGLDPNAADVLNLLGERNAAAMAPLQEELSILRKTVEQQNTSLQQVQGENWNRQKMDEARAVQAKYGPKILEENAEKVSGVLKSYPNLTVENALMIANPDAYRAHIQAEESAKAQEAIQTQYGAGLEGMIAAPGAEPTPTFQEGESMEASLRREMGPAAFRQTQREDALRQE